MCDYNKYEYSVKKLNFKNFKNKKLFVNSNKNIFFDKNSCFSPEHNEYCEIFKGWIFKEYGIIVGNNIPKDIKFTLTKTSNIIYEDNKISSGSYIKFDYEILNLTLYENFYFIYKHENLIHSQTFQLEKTPGNYTFIKYLKKGLSYFNWIYEKNIIPKFSDEYSISKVVYSEYNSRNPVIIKSISIFGSDEGEGISCQKCAMVK